jgi:hypothetical protein
VAGAEVGGLKRRGERERKKKKKKREEGRKEKMSFLFSFGAKKKKLEERKNSLSPLFSPRSCRSTARQTAPCRKTPRCAWPTNRQRRG